MNFLKYVVVLVGFFAFSIHSYADHRLRFGKLRVSDEKELILMGISIPQNPAQDPSQAPGKNPDSLGDPLGWNFSQNGGLGFEGEDLENIDPKFLLELSPRGITRVRSFELEDLNSWQVNHASTRAALPTTLLIPPKAKGEKIRHFLGNIGAGLLKTTGAPIAPITTAIRSHSKYHENLRKVRAHYLLEIINQALPNDRRCLFPEFKETLDNEYPRRADLFLRKLGLALLTRYNPESNWAGVNTAENIHLPTHDANFLEHWFKVRNDLRDKQKLYFAEQIRTQNLTPLYFGDTFAIVFADQDQANAQDSEYTARKFMGLGSRHRSPYYVASQSGLGPENGNLIPLYVVSFVNPDAIVDLANFVFPNQFSQDLKHHQRTPLKLELLGGIIPGTNLLTKFGFWAKRVHAIENLDTKYPHRQDSYGAVLALAETQGIPNIELPPGLTLSAFQLTQERLKLPVVESIANTPVQDLHQTLATIVAEQERLSRIWKAPSRQQQRAMKEAHVKRLQNYIRKQQRAPLAKNKIGGVSRSPAAISGGISSGAPIKVEAQISKNLKAKSEKNTPPERNPTILLLIDGLRPDRLKAAAEEGLMPRLKELFIDRGTHVESYASRSLTLPSWGTITTGWELDYHGVRSNSPTSRLTHMVNENFQDPRKDLLLHKNKVRNRAFQRLVEDQVGEENKVWLPGYFHKDQVIMNYMPYVDGPFSSKGGFIKDFAHNLGAYLNHTRFAASAFDGANAAKAAKLIRKDKKGNLRLIQLWLAAVDEASHLDVNLLPTVYKDIDNAVGMVLDAAKEHPVLKNATIFIMSDHGHSGGHGPYNPGDSVYQFDRVATPVHQTTDLPLLKNTGFNLTRFLAGDFRQYSDYQFVVGTASPPTPDYSYRLLGEFQMQPFYFLYQYSKEYHRKATALVDSAGDNLAQIYIKGDENWKRLNFYQLSHYQGAGAKRGQTLDILGDIIRFQEKNPVLDDPELKRRILDLTDYHPTRFIAMPLSDGRAQRSLSPWEGDVKDRVTRDFRKFYRREPVLVIAHRDDHSYRTGVIFTLSTNDGEDLFKYVVLKNFSQEADGTIHAEASLDPMDDPLGYMGQVLPATQAAMNSWRSDREWLQMARDVNHPNPTSVFALVRSTTLAPRFTAVDLKSIPEEVKLARQGEIPDFIALANPGYAFHSSVAMQGDHGGVGREEVRNSFFITSLQENRFVQHRELEVPMLTRDFMPTVLHYAGLGLTPEDPLPWTQGKSFKQKIDKINSVHFADRPQLIR